MFYFFEVMDENMMERIYRFRYDIVCEELGFFDKERYPDQKERDEYDRYSTHFVALDEECQIVATTRLIHHSPIGYPTEEHLQIYPEVKALLDTFKKEKLSEISRVFIAKKHRNMYDSKLIISNFIVGKIYPVVKDLGIEYCYSAMEKRFIRFTRMLGVRYDIIGPLQEGYGSPRYPCLLSIARLERDNPMLLENYKKRVQWFKGSQLSLQ